MIILLMVILILLTVGIFLCAGVILYAFVLMWKRPPEELYRQRAAQNDFCPFPEIPTQLIHFFLQIEDNEFFDHPGFVREAFRDAFFINLREKKIVTGGSTVTQQLVKNLYFRFHHNPLRKAAEFVITLSVERKLGKQKILELYLNIIYFGFGLYGMTHAACFYFGKRLEELSMNQIFMLACIPYAPTRGNPIRYPDAFERIRNKRVNLLLRRNTISAEDAEFIFSHHADCLDPELRKNDIFTSNYPDDIILVNDRFGPHSDPTKVTIP